MPTPHGTFTVSVYRFEAAGHEEEVVVHLGDLRGKSDVPVRVHSECLTGEVFGSLRCDCAPQLDLALRRIAETGFGALVYLRQEGRGIGLGEKIAAYGLQDSGRDTVDANIELGFAADLRNYDRAAAMLEELGVKSVRLMTNNPSKIEGLEKAGIEVASRWDHQVPSTDGSRVYLETKRTKMGHLLTEPV